MFPFEAICRRARDNLEVHGIGPVPSPPELKILQQMEATRPLDRAGSDQGEPPLCYGAADYLIEILRKPFETSVRYFSSPLLCDYGTNS